jgi:hypothetical protein
MDPWRESAVWHEYRDAVRASAAIEAKNPLIAEQPNATDAAPSGGLLDVALAISAVTRVVATVFEIWYQIMRR